MFENVYVNDDNSGHGDWLSSDDSMYDKNDIEKSRQKAIQESSLIPRREEIQEVGGFDETFGKKLAHHDVRESHENTIFRFDVNKLYHEKQKFKNVMEYQTFLQQDESNCTPLNEDQSKAFLRNRENLMNQECKEMAFREMTRKN